jgi:hypothetical protein
VAPTSSTARNTNAISLSTSTAAGSWIVDIVPSSDVTVLRTV